MGSKSSSPLDIVAGVATGGIYTVAKAANDARLEAKRAARTAADQARDAQRAQENQLKEEKKKQKQTASNTAIRSRLASRRAYMTASNRGGTLLTSPTGVLPDVSTGGKTLLGT